MCGNAAHAGDSWHDRRLIRLRPFPKRGHFVTLRVQGRRKTPREGPGVEVPPSGREISGSARTADETRLLGIGDLGLMGGADVLTDALDVGRIRESTRR